MTWLLIGGHEFVVPDASPAVVPHLEPAGEAPHLDTT
jgi:hypothetical protein